MSIQEIIDDINKVLPAHVQLTDDSTRIDLWTALFLLYGEQVQGPKGFATWKDAAINARLAGMEGKANGN